MQIREPEPADAPALIELFRDLYKETDFLLFEPGEFAPNADDYARQLVEVRSREAGAMFVCEADGRLAGVVFGNRGAARRTRHSMLVVIGIRQRWVGRGVGRQLMQTLETWARSNGIHRLELTVDAGNPRAIALYEKCGFEREGVRRHSRKIGDRYFDELYMSKLIESAAPAAASAPQGASR